MSAQADTPYLSIVVPVYNEEKRIESFLADVIDYLKHKKFSFEVLIVDDGSIDNTVPVTDGILGRHFPGKYEILKLPANRGKGGALQEGMLHAKGEFVLFLDADGSTSIEEIDRFMPEFDSEYDIYIAVRTVKHEAPFKRKFFGYGYIYLTNFLLRMNQSDFTCGFKCYSRESAQKVFALQTLDNWSFDAEDLFIAKKFGFTVKEIPVYWKHVGGSKVKVFKNIIVCGFDLLKIVLNEVRGKYKTA